jgi:tetratricopeptide (TPR) repeat protein
VFRLTLVCAFLPALAVGCSSEAAKRRHLDNGDHYRQQGKWAEATIEYRNAVNRDEFWGEARVRLAEAYAETGNPEQAFREFVRAADLMPEDNVVQLKAASYLLLAAHYEDARARIQRVLDRDPNNVDALLLLGNSLAGLKDLDGAIAQVNEALTLEPGRSQAYVNLAVFRVASGNREAAKTAFAQAVATDPSSVAAWLALANFQWSGGDADAAFESLTRAHRLDPGGVLTNRALAIYYLASDRPAEAEQHLKAIAASSHTPVAQAALVDFYVAQGRLDDARRLAEALTKHPQAAAAAEVRLANLAYIQGRPAEAHQMLDAVIIRQPNDAESLVLKARWLLGEGKAEEALELARAAVAANERNAVSVYVRGLAEAATNRTSEAIKSFNEVLRLNPRGAAARLHLSALHLRRGALDMAVLYADEAVNFAPESVEARLARVQALAVRDDVSEALAEIERLKKLASHVALVHALDGSLRLRLGNTAAARAAFTRALDLDPHSVHALEGLTRLDVSDGNLGAARARIEQRLLRASSSRDLLLLAAKVFVAARQHQRAEDVLRQVLRLDPLNIDALTMLRHVFAEQNRLPGARREFAERAQREPLDVGAKLLAAVLAHAQGDIATAAKEYAEIVAVEPRAGLAANNLAWIYAEEGRNLDVALDLAELAAQVVPNQAAVQDTLGWVHYKKRRYGPAARHFAQCIALEPTAAECHYRLGLAYAGSGDRDRAAAALRAALKLNHELAAAQQALAELNASAPLRP